MSGSDRDIPLNSSFDSFDEALDFLFRLRTFGTKLGLDTIRSLLDELGSPDASCKFIHIAGTNGKGSTAAFISSILSKAGLKTGLFTSPHLVEVTERITVNGVRIIPDDLLAILRDVHQAACRMLRDETLRYPTFFEFITAAAAVYFARHSCDVVVWETGMGGRLDATNAVTSVASVITSISYDHMQYLGDTLEQITYEKCGIIKPGIPVFTTVFTPGLLDIIQSKTSESGSDLTVITKRDISVQGTGIRHVRYSLSKNERHSFFISVDDIGIECTEIGLKGPHQGQNAACASVVSYWYLTTYCNSDPIPSIKSGLSAVSWPGRCQVISDSPRIIVDCAHNPEGIYALCNTLPDITSNQPIFVIGGLVDKKMDQMLHYIQSLSVEIWYTKPSSTRAMTCEHFTELVRLYNLDMPLKTFNSASEVMIELNKPEHASQTFVITGSCYLVGDVLSEMKGNRRDIRTDDPLSIEQPH